MTLPQRGLFPLSHPKKQGDTGVKKGWGLSETPSHSCSLVIGGRSVPVSRDLMYNPEQQCPSFGQKISLLQSPQPRNIQNVLKGQQGH